MKAKSSLQKAALRGAAVAEPRKTPNEKSKFACCFCGKAILKTHIDPCVVLLVANWQSKPKEQADQQFWCHFACFKSALSDKVPLLIETLVASRISASRGTH